MNELERSGPRILLVEDDEDDAILMTHLLEELWPEAPSPEWCGNLDDALGMMTSNLFDVYLMDYRLGAQNGLELLSAARRAGCRGPVILLTGQGDRETDLEAAKAGAADFLPKTELSPHLLERSIRYAIANDLVRRELSETQRRLSESREDERTALARDLHDGPLQELIGVRFLLTSMKTGTTDPHVAERATTVLDSLDQVTSTLRALCGELRPPALTPFGLARALRSHAERIAQEHHDLEVRLTLDEDDQAIPDATRLALFRVYQHAVSNVLRHADASQMTVRLHVTRRLARLEIEDDGRGFVVPERWLDFGRLGHFGFLGASERAEALGGRLFVRSQIGEGTLVRVDAPIEPYAGPYTERGGTTRQANMNATISTKGDRA